MKVLILSLCCLVVLVSVWWGYVHSTKADDVNFNLKCLKHNPTHSSASPGGEMHPWTADHSRITDLHFAGAVMWKGTKCVWLLTGALPSKSSHTGPSVPVLYLGRITVWRTTLIMVWVLIQQKVRGCIVWPDPACLSKCCLI